MKKSILYIVVLTLVCASCSREEERLFSQSAAERSRAAIERAETILAGAPNGWHMVYFANPEKKTYAHLGLIFMENGQVEVSMANGSAIKKDKESLWEVVNDICPILTFNTYNNIMHIWADPQTNGLGYEGDYEFLVLEATPERVRLKGKKYGAYTVLYPLKSGEDILSISEAAANAKKKVLDNNNLLEYQDGDQLYTVFNDDGILRFAQHGKIFEVEDPSTPVAPMPNGVQVMKTMTGANNTNRFFSFGSDGYLYAESAVIRPSSQYVRNYMQLKNQGWTLDMNTAVPAGLQTIIAQINEELRDLAGQKGAKRKAKILSLRLTYNEDHVFGEQIITYLMEMKYTDNKTEYGHIYYEFKVDFSGEAFSLSYLRPQDSEEKQAEYMLEKVPTLKSLFDAMAGTYNYIPVTPINPSLGVNFVNTDTSKDITISAVGTAK